MPNGENITNSTDWDYDVYSAMDVAPHATVDLMQVW